jgi:UDP-N-acetylmuramate dehydrogenase
VPLLAKGFLEGIALANPGLGIIPMEPLSGHTSLGVGGPAALFARPESEVALIGLLGLAKKEGLPALVIGGGTNILFLDGGYPGLVIRLGSKAFGSVGKLPAQGGRQLVRAGAGAPLSGLVSFAMGEGLTGFEDLAGIPGTVGGALRMNAGAKAQSMGDQVLELEAMDLESFGKRAFAKEDLAFLYRETRFPIDAPLVLSATFALDKAEDPELSKERMRLRLSERERSIPPGRSAGSFFRNPQGDYAGRLIEGCGLKGRRIGAAAVSGRHANVLLNEGGASASDFMNLSGLIEREVEARYGVRLQREVRVEGSELPFLQD